jgi:hypothetical protein
MKRWRRRVTATIVGLAMVFVSVGLSSPAPTEATWNSPEYHQAVMTTAQLYPVTSLTCNSSGGLLATSIGFTWTRPVITGNGLTPTSYTIVWSGSAGAGQKTVTGLTTTLPGTILTVAGSSTVTVYANFDSWQSPVSTQSRQLNTTLGVLGIIVGWTCG